MISIGAIGLGDMGLAHVRGFSMIGDCSVDALCDFDNKRIEEAKNVLKGKKVKSFNDYRDLLNIKGLDAVVISAYNYLHNEVAIEAMRKGKDVFLEKPVAHTLSSCDEIIIEWGESHSILQIGFTYRYASLYRHMARMIEKGDFGDVMMASCREYRDNFPLPWFFDENKSGGAIVEKNCHHFDIFNWMIKSRALRVFAMGGRHVAKGEKYEIQCSYAREKGLLIDNPTIVDHANVLVEYENGALGNLALCMYERTPIEGLEIGLASASGAHAVMERDNTLKLGGGRLGPVKKYKLDMLAETAGIGHIGCQLQRREFIRSIKERTEPYADIFTGREAALICFAAEKSIKEKRIIELSELENKTVTAVMIKKNRLRDKSTPAAVNELIPV